MKKFVFIVLAFALIFSFYGCGKKQQTLEEMQQPMSMETLSTMNTNAPAATTQAPQAVESKAPEAKVEQALSVTTKAVKLEPLPPAGPYKPSIAEIQKALIGAGFYTGKADGKAGPMTKKAVSAFQKANGLTPDGRVGPKTWSALSKYLSAEPTTQAPSQTR